MANDFRGYVQTQAPNLLGFVGNDGGINAPKVQAALKGNSVLGSSLYGFKDLNAVQSAVNNLAQKYQAGTSSGSSAPSAGSTVASSSSSSAPADLSSYDQAIDSTNAQINNLDPSLNNLLGGIYNNYQTTVNGLNQSKATTDQKYKTAKTSDAQDYSGAKNTIRTNTGATINSVDNLLGSHGGGGQSAGDYAALLAGKAGTSQLTGAGTNFGKNEQNLDTNYNDFLGGYNTNLTNAGLQRDADINSAQANIKTQKANLLQSLATTINQRTAAAGGSGTGASQKYVDEAKNLLGEAATLGAPKPIAAQTPLTYTAPTLESYTTNPTTVAAGGQSATNDSTVSPFLTTLLGRNRTLQVA